MSRLHAQLVDTEGGQAGKGRNSRLLKSANCLVTDSWTLLTLSGTTHISEKWPERRAIIKVFLQTEDLTAKSPQTTLYALDAFNGRSAVFLQVKVETPRFQHLG